MINPPHSGKIKSEIEWLRYEDDLVLLKNWILLLDWFQNKTERYFWAMFFKNCRQPVFEPVFVQADVA